MKCDEIRVVSDNLEEGILGAFKIKMVEGIKK